MKKLPLSFYNRKDVVSIARELIGKILVPILMAILLQAELLKPRPMLP